VAHTFAMEGTDVSTKAYLDGAVNTSHIYAECSIDSSSYRPIAKCLAAKLIHNHG